MLLEACNVADFQIAAQRSACVVHDSVGAARLTRLPTVVQCANAIPRRPSRMNPSDDNTRAASDALPGMFGANLHDTAWLGRVGGAVDAAIPPSGLLGPYELLAVAGRGGQGVVLKARDPRTQRIVALKRLAAGAFVTEESRLRFQREIRATAALDHPGIVAVHGCELIDDQPVAVMQWVDGTPLDRWALQGAPLLQPPTGAPANADCAAVRTPSRREVIALFVRTCEAVHHAHQRGVIHRDLKPSNVLVDAQHQPHVLDFGLAKLRDGEESSQLTASGYFLGTPMYAAPEQARADHAAVDVRTDVYALGVMLYVALTGRTPFDSSQSVMHLLDAVQRADPPAPSRVSPQLDEEIDAIVMKALQKDKEQRYASVDALAGDLRRYLDGQTVLAHPPNTTYKLRKFVRRHKAGVAVASAFVALLTSATVVATALYLRAESNAARARDEADQARATAQIIRGWLTAANPAFGVGAELRARELLDLGARQLDQAALRPDSIESLRLTLADAYQGLGLYDDATEQLQAALHSMDMRRAPDADRALAMAELAECAHSQGRIEEADTLLQQAERIAAAQLPRDELHEQLLRVRRGQWLRAAGRLDDAERELRGAIDRLEALGGRDDPRVGDALQALSLVLRARGDAAGAKEVLARSAAIAEAHPEHDLGTPILRRHDLASVMNDMQRYAEAEPVFRDVLTRFRARYGRNHPLQVNTLCGLGVSLNGQRRYAEALAVFDEAAQIARSAASPNHELIAACLHNKGHALDALGDARGATEAWEQALASRRRVLPANHPELLWSIYDLAWQHVQQQRAEDAEPLFVEAVAGARARPADRARDELLGAALAGLGNCRLVLDRPADAIDPLREALEVRARIDPEGWSPQNTARLLGTAHVRAGDRARGEPMMLDAAEKLLAHAATPPFVRGEVIRGVAETYERLGESDRAEKWRSRMPP